MSAVRVRRVNPRRRAFTLLEVLMVIVILGVLAALLVPQFVGTGEKAKIDAARIFVTGTIGTQLNLFRTHCGRYPTTEEGLKALLVKPDDEEIAAKWGGPYVSKIEKDPWGSDYVYESPGTYNEDSYDLSSPGPNRRSGDEDDVTNWEKT